MPNQFSDEYLKYIQSEDWRQKAERRKALDGHCCVLCGSAEKLQVHHLHYRSLMRENVETDLITLCEDCHRMVHENKNEVIDGMMHAWLWLKLEETPGGAAKFLAARGITSPEIVDDYVRRNRDALQVFRIPIPGGEGCLTVPYSAAFRCEKDDRIVCEYLGEDYEESRLFYRHMYYMALENMGFVEELPA